MVEQRNAGRVFCGDYIHSGIVVLNVSSSGALITSEKQMELGTIMLLPLRLGPVLRVECNATVKWCKETDCDNYMMGVSFAEEQHGSQLNRYVDFLRTLENLVA